MLMAGLPLRFEGAVRAALFMIARENPISWIRSAPGWSRAAAPPRRTRRRGWSKPSRSRRLRRGPPWPRSSPAAMDSIAAAALEVEPVPRRFEPEAHLGRQLLYAIRVGVTEIAATNATWPAIDHWPRAAGARGDIDDPQTRRSCDELRSGGHDVGDVGAHLAVPRSGMMATVRPARSKVPSAASQPPTAGRLSGSRVVEAVAAVEVARSVAHRPAQAPWTLVSGSMLDPGPWGCARRWPSGRRARRSRRGCGWIRPRHFPWRSAVALPPRRRPSLPTSPPECAPGSTGFSSFRGARWTCS